MADQMNAGDPIYDGTSDLYVKGDVTLRPPSGPDLEGLPARPSADAIRDIRIDLQNGRAELAQSRQARAKYAAHLTSLDITAERAADDEETQGALARLAALDLEAETMGEAFPAAREQERAELQERYVTSPDRVASVLETKVALEAAREKRVQAGIASDERRLEQVEGVEALHRRRELEHAARRVYWEVATEADLRRLREAKVDLDRIARRQQPSR